MRVIDSPTNGMRVIYQITLNNGLIVTNPSTFESDTDAPPVETNVHISEDGRLLIPLETPS